LQLYIVSAIFRIKKKKKKKKRKEKERKKKKREEKRRKEKKRKEKKRRRRRNLQTRSRSTRPAASPPLPSSLLFLPLLPSGKLLQTYKENGKCDFARLIEKHRPLRTYV